MVEGPVPRPPLLTRGRYPVWWEQGGTYKTNVKYVYWSKVSKKWHVRRISEDGKVRYVGLTDTLQEALQMRSTIVDGKMKRTPFVEHEGRLCKPCNKTTCTKVFDVVAFAPSARTQGGMRFKFDLACKDYETAKEKKDFKAMEAARLRVDSLAIQTCHHCRCISKKSQCKRRAGENLPRRHKKRKLTEVEELELALDQARRRLQCYEASGAAPPSLLQQELTTASDTIAKYETTYGILA